eukprot:2370732-Karenia_brevis.AAC.1
MPVCLGVSSDILQQQCVAVLKIQRSWRKFSVKKCKEIMGKKSDQTSFVAEIDDHVMCSVVPGEFKKEFTSALLPDITKPSDEQAGDTESP